MNIGADHYMEAKLLVPRYRRVERAVWRVDTSVALSALLAARESAADSSVQSEGTLPRGFRLNRFWATNEKSPGGNRGSTVTETLGAEGCAKELYARSILHSRCPASTDLCHDNTEIHPQPSRGAAPPSADPALDTAAAAAWLPGSIGGLDGPVPTRQRQRRSTAHA